MKYIVHTSDIHLGLTTNEIDRTEEIVQVTLQAARKAIRYKKKNKDVLMVFGGDIFNHNNPSENLIGQFIRILNVLKKHDVATIVLVGNHDSISDPDRKSCLDFINKIRVGYPNIELVDDIKMVHFFQSDLGEVYLTFLPHITKAHLKGTKYKKVQDYINKKAQKIKEEIGQGQHNYIFSHLNVKGIIPGSEENLLRKSEVWIPDCFIMDKEHKGYLPPVIIQAHIHTRSKINNVNVIGSPIFCNFGEKEKNKYFAVIHIPESFNEKHKIKYIKTDCKKFIEFDWDVTAGDLTTYDDLMDIAPELDKNTVLKVNAIQTIHQNIDWNGIRKELTKKCNFVKPIQPRIIRDRVKRNKRQQLNLSPKDAIKIWLKKNKPKDRKIIRELANDYIDKLIVKDKKVYHLGKELKIYSLELKNFMAYKKLKIIFNDKDVIGIICNYINNKKKSNFGGKTTIIEGIKYAAFGLSRASNEISLIHKGKELMWAKLVLIDADGVKYPIKRGRDINNKGMLECGWVEKKREAQEAINDLIGSDEHDFELTSFFDQEDINGFMNLKPAKMKEFMMRWLQNLHWTELSKMVSEDLKELNDQLEELRIKKETLTDDIGIKSEVKDEIKESKRQNRKLILEKEDIEKRLNKLKKTNILSSKQIKKLKVVLSELNDSIKETKEELDNLVNVKKEYKKCKIAITKYDKELGVISTKELNKESNKISNGINNKRRDIKEMQELIDTVKEDFTGMCPVLKEKCGRIEYNPKTVKKWKKKIKVFSGELSKLKEEERAISYTREKLEIYGEMKNTLKNIKLELKGTKTLEKSLEHQKRRRKAIQKRLKDGVNPKIDRKIERLSDTVSQLSECVSESNQKLGALVSNLSRIIKTRKKIKRIKSEAIELERNIIQLKYISLIFGKNGISSQEIENAFDAIEDDINFILDKMQCGLDVSFSADRELGKWEENCVVCNWRFPKGTRLRNCESCGESRKKKRRDELSLKVTKNGIESDFEMNSGGGKVLISMAVRIALTRLKQRQTGSNFMVLFLDEPDKSLDEHNSESFMNLITTTLTKNFSFLQLFWISHSKKINSSIPHALIVDRYKKYSKARWL